MSNDHSTSSAVAVKIFAIVVLAVGLALVVGPLQTWMMAGQREPGHLANIVVACPMGLGFVAMAIYLWAFTGQATWELEPDGIAFQGPSGVRKHLLWRDVERVHWTHEGVRLHGREEQISLGWKQLRASDRPEVYRRLLLALRPDFDIPVPKEGRGAWSTVGIPLLKVGAYVSWIFASLSLSKWIVPHVFSAILPAMAPFAGRWIFDDTVLRYLSFAVFMAVFLGLASPAILLMNGKTWFDRRAT